MKVMGIAFERVAAERPEEEERYLVYAPPEEGREEFVSQFPCTPSGWEEAWTVFVSLIDSKGRRLHRNGESGPSGPSGPSGQSGPSGP